MCAHLLHYACDITLRVSGERWFHLVHAEIYALLI
jgi:hypothetical protein